MSSFFFFLALSMIFSHAAQFAFALFDFIPEIIYCRETNQSVDLTLKEKNTCSAPVSHILILRVTKMDLIAIKWKFIIAFIVRSLCICNAMENIQNISVYNNDNNDNNDQVHTGQSVCLDSIYLKSLYKQHVGMLMVCWTCEKCLQNCI